MDLKGFFLLIPGGFSFWLQVGAAKSSTNTRENRVGTCFQVDTKRYLTISRATGILLYLLAKQEVDIQICKMPVWDFDFFASPKRVTYGVGHPTKNESMLFSAFFEAHETEWNTTNSPWWWIMMDDGWKDPHRPSPRNHLADCNLDQGPSVPEPHHLRCPESHVVNMQFFGALLMFYIFSGAQFQGDLGCSFLGTEAWSKYIDSLIIFNYVVPQVFIGRATDILLTCANHRVSMSRGLSCQKAVLNETGNVYWSDVLAWQKQLTFCQKETAELSHHVYGGRKTGLRLLLGWPGWSILWRLVVWQGGLETNSA